MSELTEKLQEQHETIQEQAKRIRELNADLDDTRRELIEEYERNGKINSYKSKEEYAKGRSWKRLYPFEGSWEG